MAKKKTNIQLNKYETAPNFIQLSQNMQELRKNREIQLNQQTFDVKF